MENSSVTIKSCGETCPFCGSLASVVDGRYEYYDDFIRVTVAATASREDRAAVEGFVAALARRAPPTPEAIDEEFAEVDPEVRDWFKRLLATVDWKRLRAFLKYLLPILVSIQMSQATDSKIEEVDTRVRELQRQTEQIQREWRQYMTNNPAVTPHPPSPRATPKGTPPRQPDPKRSRGKNAKRQRRR